MTDIHDRYLRGVGDLLQSVGPADVDYLVVLTLQGRLAQAIAEMRQYGPTDNSRVEIARVTTELDRISLEKLHQSFRSLCGILDEPPAQPEILHNLPPRTFFVGRQREIRVLHEYLSPDERVALISIDGIGGIGKTALAREMAHQLVEERAFQAVVWATAKRRSLSERGITEERPDFTSLDELLVIIATVLRRSSSGIGAAVVRQMLAESRSLVVVDNFETVQDDKVFWFLRRVPGNSKALITNRHRPAAEIRGGELVLPLKGMKRADAIQLLRRAGRTIPPPLAEADESLLGMIYERAHGNPLAMEWFVAQVERGQSVQRVLQRLGQPKANDLYEFIFEDSYSALSAEATRALWAIAAIDSPAVADQVCYVAELAPGEFERVLDELIGTSLVAFDHLSGRYTILEITREYVVALMGKELERWARRTVDWETRVRYERLDETAKEAMQLLTRTDKPVPIPTLVRWLGGIGSNILSHLVTSLQEAGLAVYDEALQMITLDPRVREVWHAQLAGSGAVVQGDGTIAASAGGVCIGGDVVVSGRDFVGGDKNVVVPQYSLERYLNYLLESRSGLRLLAIDPSIVEMPPLRLADVFVPLYTTQRRSDTRGEGRVARILDRQEESDAPVSMLDAVTSARRIVILGEPGSGKTTLLHYLVWAVASRRLGTEVENLPKELDGFPISILARDYAGLLATGSDIPFVEFLSRNLASLGFSDLIEYFRAQLAAGECLILIDGLDEVADERQRRQIVTRIEDFVLQYPQNRVAVTSRVTSLQGVPLFPAEWVTFVIAPLTDEQIDFFITSWYGLLARTGSVDAETAESKARSLSYALRQHRQLRSLAVNPLLLTVIAVLHTYRGILPASRATLYYDVSDLLIRRWERAKIEGASLVDELDTSGLRTSDLQSALAEVAFRVQASRGTAINETSLLGIIAPNLDSDWNRAMRFALYVRERAGLLVERAVGEYSFVHLTLQEFYAARYLASREGYPWVGIELLRTDFDLWRESYLLSVLYLDQIGLTARAIEAIQALCPQDHWKSEIDLRFIALAGQATAEIGLLRVERTFLGNRLAHSVRTNLVQLLESGMLSAGERAFAGDVLADIGDPRFAFTLAGDMLVPDIAWCEVPVGPFLMGSSKEKDHDASDDEQPQHRVELPAYRAGRYPVTNAQYRYFIESGGYSERQYWTEQGWAWHQDQGIESPQFWDDPTWNRSNHPVVGVSWYEAVAFTRWLTMHLRKAGLLPEQMVVRLLAEVEWEKTARGSDGRIYPWGDEWDPERANTRESELGQTTAVSVYPAGASPYGCLDMSGNVWEWTLSLWGREDSRTGFRYPYRSDDGREDMDAEGRRIIRGGSWASPCIHARATFRGMADPRTRNSMIGFRVALCPITPEPQAL
jgi:formylglycine-generating enzyme required for sulfatase activity